VVAARRPIFGGERVAAFLARVAHRGWRAGDQTRFVDVNGQPGFLIGQDAWSPCSCSASPKGVVQPSLRLEPGRATHLLRRERP
jgi:hypothetical protein